MGMQLREWKTAVVATSPHAPKALAAGWVVTRLFVYEAAILLPINTWASLIPLPSVSVFIIALATLTLNVLYASNDASRLLDWFEKNEVELFFTLFVRGRLIPVWHHRALTQIIVSLQISSVIAIPIALLCCIYRPDSTTTIILFDLPALMLSLTALLLSPMPLGSDSPHWFLVTIRLFTPHFTKSWMKHCINVMDWDAVTQHPQWGAAAMIPWISGRVSAALIWQLPSMFCLHFMQGWLWPTAAGTWISVSFMIFSAGLTGLAATGAAIQDWRRVTNNWRPYNATFDCYGVVETMLASLDNPPTSRTIPDPNALLVIQLIPITVGLVVGRAAYSLPVAILFLTFVAYSQIHAIAWSYAGLVVRLPCAPPIVEETVIRRPPDEVVGEAIWASESDIQARADEILKHAEQGLEED